MPRYLSKTLCSVNWIAKAFLLFLPTCLSKASDKQFKLPIAHSPLQQLVFPHKPIYLLPFHNLYDLDGPSYFRKLGNKSLGASHQEIEIQAVSFKLLLATYKSLKGYATYTQRGNWQFYNVQDPYFRVSQYELGFFGEIPLKLLRRNHSLRVGVLHQSNGLGHRATSARVDELDLERALDRFYASWFIKNQRTTYLIKVWRVFSFDKMGPAYLNYNPDIQDFLGHMKIAFSYNFSKDHYVKISRLFFQNKRYFVFDRTMSLMYLFPVLPSFQLIFKGHIGYGSTVTTYRYPTLEGGVGFCFRFASP